MRKVAQSPLDNVLDDKFDIEEDTGDEGDENLDKFEDSSPEGQIFEVMFYIDYDAGADPQGSPEEDAETRTFAVDLFEDMFGVELNKPDADYGVTDETAYMFTVPKDQIKELIAKIHQFSDMDGGDFVPLIDDLVAFDFNLIDPAGADPEFPRHTQFEDEIRFSDWEERL